MRQLQQQRSAREQERLFVAEGARLTDDFLRAGMRAQFALITQNETATVWQAAHADVECVTVSDAVMKAASSETTPPGVLVVFAMPAPKPEQRYVESMETLLVLDGLRDPGNLGACLRVAAGAGCAGVILTPGSVDAYNPKVIRGGMGAHARLDIASLDWLALPEACAGRRILIADAQGSTQYAAVNWAEPTALILGSEAAGVSAQARAMAHDSISIPLMNAVESLNAAVACGVILFEAARQRRITSSFG